MIVMKSSFFRLNGLPRLSALIFLLAKIVSGIAFWAVYTYYYTEKSTGDIHNYFRDAGLLYEIKSIRLKDYLDIVLGIDYHEDSYATYYNRMTYWYKRFEDSPFNESRMMIRINAIFYFLSSGCIHIHSLFFSFISMVGTTFLYRTFREYTPGKEYTLSFILFLTPSTLFWTSGLLREPLMMLGFGFLLYGVLVGNLTIAKRVLFVLLGTPILLVTKFYLIYCLIPPAIAYTLTSRLHRSFIGFIGVNMLILFFVLLIDRVFPQYSILQMLLQKQRAFLNISELWNSGSVISLPRLDDSVWSLITAYPVAFFNAFFRPLPTDAGNIMILVNSIETLTYVSYILWCFRYLLKSSEKNLNIILFLLNFSLILYGLIGYTVPVLGALVRYRIPGLLCFLLVAVMLDKEDRIRRIVRG